MNYENKSDMSYVHLTKKRAIYIYGYKTHKLNTVIVPYKQQHKHQH